SVLVDRDELTSVEPHEGFVHLEELCCRLFRDDVGKPIKILRSVPRENLAVIQRYGVHGVLYGLYQKSVIPPSIVVQKGRNANCEVVMANKTQPFRSHHITRALRAAVAAGVPNPTVEFHSPDGGKIIVGGKPVVKAAVRAVVKAPLVRPVRG